MKGKVWLVGAGPGDVGLMTLKGREVLQNADVVVYDALVAPGVLGLIPEGARRVFAGKRSGNHFLRQEETNKVLLEEALAGAAARSWSCWWSTTSPMKSSLALPAPSRYRPIAASPSPTGITAPAFMWSPATGARALAMTLILRRWPERRAR